MQNSIESILFATDFSDAANHALDFALTIAQRLEARLTLFHAIPEVFDFAARSERILEEELEETKKRFKKQKKALKKQEAFKDLDISWKVSVGRPVAEVNKAAVESEADLIVLGYMENEDASSLKKVLFGNITSDVILSSNRPVLAVPLHAEEQTFRKMVFATNYNPGEPAMLDFVTMLADEFVSEVDLVHVDEEESDDHAEQFENYRDWINTTVTDYHFTFAHLVDEDFGRALNNYLKKCDADLLVMGRKKRNFLQYIFTMGEAKELNFCRKIPLLVLPVPELST